jgi:hypothetical protein
MTLKAPKKHPQITSFLPKRLRSEQAQLRAIALKIKTPEQLETTLIGLNKTQRNAVIMLIRQYLPFDPDKVTPVECREE